MYVYCVAFVSKHLIIEYLTYKLILCSVPSVYTFTVLLLTNICLSMYTAVNPRGGEVNQIYEFSPLCLIQTLNLIIIFKENLGGTFATPLLVLVCELLQSTRFGHMSSTSWTGANKIQEHDWWKCHNGGFFKFIDHYSHFNKVHK